MTSIASSTTPSSTLSSSSASSCSDGEKYSQLDKNLAFFFDEGKGYLFVKYVGKPTEGQVMLVRSVADGQLYIRKVSWPRIAGNDIQRDDEVTLWRPHTSTPAHIESKYYFGTVNHQRCRYTSLISQYCNGGDLRMSTMTNDLALPSALLWHLFERLLTVLYHLHYECSSPVAHRDIHPRNIFLHWKESDNLPEVFLGDFGAAMPIKFASPTGQVAFAMQRTVRHDYELLWTWVNQLVVREQNLGRTIPGNFLKLLDSFHKATAFQKDERDQPQLVFERNKHQIQRMIRSIRYASKAPIAAYRDQADMSLKRVLDVSNRPVLGSTEEVMMMLHPRPIGPFKVVEVDTGTFEILGVRKEINEAEGFARAVEAMPTFHITILIMLSLRRSALRIISSSPSSFVSKPRTITPLSSSTFTRSKPVQFSLYQRRWASDEAEAPISKLQPTPVEEVENAIKTEDAEDAAPVANATESAGVFAPAESKPRDRMERANAPKETVYVGNLFFDVTEEDLQREMARFGSIRKCRMMRDARGLSKGFAYVDFETTEAATAAIDALHQQLYEGRRMVVQYAAYTTSEMDARRHEGTRFNNVPRGPKNPPTKTLFIGNMSFEMTDKDLNKLFTGIRNVTDVRVAIDRRTGQPRGFAHADFTDVASAQEAMKVLSEKETYGRQLRIDYSFGSSMAPRNQNPPPSRQGGRERGGTDFE